MENKEIILTDITGVIGQWLAEGFDDEVPLDVVVHLNEAYHFATKKLNERLPE